MSNSVSIGKKVLLTGAGFTKDFGGFLAIKMWNDIFNSRLLDDSQRIKDLLRKDFSYESVYHEIIESAGYTGDEKSAIKKAVESAYDSLDENIRTYKHRNTSRAAIANSTSLSAFIKEFYQEKRSFFFTLNQDMFIERYCRNVSSEVSLVPLGIIPQGVSQAGALPPEAYQQLPKEEKLADLFKEDNANNPLRTHHLHYVKLHGSYNWKDSEGNAYMVIGKNKKEKISKEPLLRRFFTLFEEVLSSSGVELFVIGYGFGDEHINKVIADAISNNGLRLYVMNPVEPRDFSEDLKSKPHCENLWKSLRGYYPYSVSTVFPRDGSTTMEYQLIMKNFFLRQVRF